MAPTLTVSLLCHLPARSSSSTSREAPTSRPEESLIQDFKQVVSNRLL